MFWEPKADFTRKPVNTPVSFLFASGPELHGRSGVVVFRRKRSDYYTAHCKVKLFDSGEVVTVDETCLVKEAHLCPSSRSRSGSPPRTSPS